MPIIPSSPTSVTGSATYSFAIPSGSWTSGTWTISGNCTGSIVYFHVTVGDTVVLTGWTSGSGTATGALDTTQLAAVNAAQGGTLSNVTLIILLSGLITAGFTLTLVGTPAGSGGGGGTPAPSTKEFRQRIVIFPSYGKRMI